MWFYNGVLHRDNGPAIEEIDGSNTWYRHGLHGILKDTKSKKKFAARVHRREARTRAFILDRMLPIIYNPPS